MASRGKTLPRSQMFVADFETCDCRQLTEEEIREEVIVDQKVWLAGYQNLETMEIKRFTNLDDFMNDILSRKSNMNSEYAIHNLKFDGSYIVPWLFKENYQFTHSKPQPKQFSVLVDIRNAWYSITIQVTKRRRVTIWDSAKLFPMPLEYLPDIYHTTTKKLREDNDFYNRFRPEGYEPNEEEINYLNNDLQVLAETLNKHIEYNTIRFKKTQAGQAFYNFEQSFKAWKWRFPPLSNEVDDLIRPAYWGGISHASKQHQGKDQFHIGVMDINSSYPHKAAESKLPYGEILHEYGEGKHPDMSKFWIADVLVSFTLKPNCLPCIPSKAIIEGREIGDKDDKWMDKSNGVVRLRLSCIDYITFQMSYEIKVYHWNWSIHWAWKVQKEIAKFVYTNNDIKVKYSKLAKQTTNPELKAEYNTMRNRAKTDNNAFYGKFGEDIIKEGKTPYYEEDDIVWRCDHEEELSEHKRKFLPVAIAITAWGRQQLVTVANILGEDFLYCDTDSVHYLKNGQYKINRAASEGIIEIDPEKLGAWAHEGDFKRGRYLRAKCYMEETPDGKLEATVAGLPADKHSGLFSKKRSCLNWDNFHIGHNVPKEKANKLRTIRTKTGNKLIPTDFTIREKEVLFV